jgi:sugar/nucleoside kinase (ribokinase family)
LTQLLVVGSVALDDLAGPFGEVTGEPGGSAVYFALAAALFGPVAIHAPVGRDHAERFAALLSGRTHPIDLSGLVVVEAPTYRWRARQAAGSNVDRGSRDTIYDHWRPSPPAGFTGWAFLGSMRPDRQAEAAAGLPAARLFGDSMRSYVASLPEQAAELLGRCRWFFANEEELAALGGNPTAPDRFRREAGLEGLVVKAGAGGATVYQESGSIHVPALRSQRVVDVTGAGDALAGGMLARWIALGAGPVAVHDALLHGTACASIAISDIGVRALARARPTHIAGRVAELRAATGSSAPDTGRRGASGGERRARDRAQ